MSQALRRAHLPYTLDATEKNQVQYTGASLQLIFLEDHTKPSANDRDCEEAIKKRLSWIQNNVAIFPQKRDVAHASV